MKFLSVLFILMAGLAQSSFASEALKSLPVQDGGRIKPYDSFARENLQLVYGREKIKDSNGLKKEAADVVFTWMIAPELWMEQKIIQVRHNGLRKALKLDDQVEVYHSLSELLGNSNVALLIKDANAKTARGFKLNPYDQAVKTLERQISMMLLLTRSQSMAVSPGGKDGRWLTVGELEGDEKESFTRVQQAFAAQLSQKVTGKKIDTEALDTRVDEFVGLLKNKYGEQYAPFNQIKFERMYKKYQPFMLAWILYLLSAILLTAFIVNGRKFYLQSSTGVMALAVILHMLGFALRVLITGRAPVTSMYETVVWVPFVSLACAYIFDRIYDMKFVRVLGLLSAVFCMILSDLSPVVLDPTLQPLEPVLRDNFWLVTHVVMIVSSYGAFLLAFFVGDLVLYYIVRDEVKYKKQIKQGVQAIYRSIQIGVVLLAGGTILGGVWADYSWGRFWGWDPKETWAFIALMGYLVLLHARLTGWVKNLGMAVGAVLGFSLVIMAWYGVNFILGAGLHSYGFGAGGVEYVSGFVALHLVYVAYVVAYKRMGAKEK